jgi:hypothetical protein
VEIRRGQSAPVAAGLRYPVEALDFISDPSFPEFPASPEAQKEGRAPEKQGARPQNVTMLNPWPQPHPVRAAGKLSSTGPA